MDYKINVLKIDDTWNCCNYKLRVFVEEKEFSHVEYVLETLKKWFGEAEYFSTNRTDFPVRAMMFLAWKK